MTVVCLVKQNNAYPFLHRKTKKHVIVLAVSSMPMVSWRIQIPHSKSLTLGLLHISLKGHIKILCSPNLLGAQMEELNKSTQRSIRHMALRQAGAGAGPRETGTTQMDDGHDAARQNRSKHTQASRPALHSQLQLVFNIEL